MKKGIFSIIMLSSTLLAFAQNYPMSDPNNTGQWILNEALSDEFDGEELDRSKWWILGEEINGELDYRNKWKGRAPGQFVEHNVFLEDGNLILRSQWEPDYQFINEKHAQSGTYYGGSKTAPDNSQPITQSCILSEGMAKYGYMEVRYKAADAPVTSAFWTTGYRSEIDMTENFGKRPIGNPENKPESLERKYRTNIISWEPNLPSDHKQWKKEKDMGVRLSEDYHVFGFEWDRDYVKTYMDGQLVQYATRYQLENYEYKTGKFHNQWVIKYPMEFWLDAEVFEWYGLPSAADLATPADHQIDYVRIWQKEIAGPYFDALGFEGPFYYKYNGMENKRSVNWWAAGNSAFKLNTEKVYDGDASLKYEQSTVLSKNQTMYSPYGSIDLPAGDNSLSCKIWIEEGCQVKNVKFKLQNPGKTIATFDISSLPRGQWVDLNKTFSRSASVLNVERADRLYIQVDKADISGTNNTFYIDHIRFENNNDQWTNLNSPSSKKKIKVYPNPVKSRLNLKASDNIEYVEIYALSGKLIKRVAVNNTNYHLDVSDLSTSLYVLKMKTSKNEISSEIISVL